MAGRFDTERYVLDGYSLLTFLEGGRGADRVRELMEMGKAHKAQIATSVVNVGEVLSIVERERGLPSAQAVLARLWDLPVQRHEAGEPLALAAARLHTQQDMTYSDCFALALARQMGATLVTGNSALEKADDMVEMEWL